MLKGKDRGKTGSVTKAMPREDKVVIDGINMKKKHQKKTQGGAGQVVEFAAPIHVSNVAIVDPKSKKGTRVGKKMVKDKYVRIAKKSGVEV